MASEFDMQHFGFPTETLIIFFSVITVSVYLDLMAHKKQPEISLRDATLWSLFWVALSLGFYAYVWFRFSPEWAGLFLAGYALEKSLSIDNLMVFMAIFASFNIKSHLQHRILYWGILGALVFRAIFVVLGTSLLAASPWVGFVFAALVAYSAVKMMGGGGNDDDEEIEDYSDHWSVRFTRRLLPIYPRLFGDRFFVKRAEIDELAKTEPAVTQGLAAKAMRFATPALLCLAAIETSDIMFAFDSVPAVIAMTQEPLLVYAAMIFAILGLRSMYFVLAALARALVHLEKAVIALLFFIAAKLALESLNKVGFDTGMHISPNVSLLVVVGFLTLGVVASLVTTKAVES